MYTISHKCATQCSTRTAHVPKVKTRWTIDSSVYVYFFFVSIHSQSSDRDTKRCERSYGVLKRRFSILHSGMQLRRPHLIQKIVSVCCMLHNLCIEMGADVDLNAFGIPANDNDDDNIAPPHVSRANPQRQSARDEIVPIFAERLLAQ